ncbi:MAG: hypothetical protein U9Q33_12135 [Campylobacterota bacterium]|nr:hypothetical protein [Campylobacterota bacterium]
MREMILVSQTPIVKQIFKLVCSKLYIKLDILDEAQIDRKVDIIIMDKEYVDDRFNILKTYSKRIGALSKEDLPFEFANDFVIPLPFLPSQLQKILEDQLEIINQKEKSKTYVSNIEENYNPNVGPLDDDIAYKPKPQEFFEEHEDVDPAIDYIASLAEGVAKEIQEDTDDSIVHLASLQQTSSNSVLDKEELSKIEEMINPQNDVHNAAKVSSSSSDMDGKEEDEWLDLASIIDQAIDEVNHSESYFEDVSNKPIKLLLNNYSMNELKPLLSLLNQDIIDKLTEGEEITIQLRVGNQ